MGRRLASIAICAVALAACRVDATVTVRMRHNGGGTVSVAVKLDHGAVRAAEIGGGKLEARVRLADLPAAGWKVTPWVRDRTGGATLTVSKIFNRPAEVASIVREISGPKGPLQHFSASRRASMFTTHWRVNGTVDLRAARVGIASDPQLVANLTAERVDIPGIESRVDASLKDLHIHAVALLPHEVHRQVSASFGSRGVLAAAADDTNFNRIVLLFGGIATGVAALFLLVVGERRVRRNRRAM